MSRYNPAPRNLPKDYRNEINFGFVNNATMTAAIGENDNVLQTFTDVWMGGGSLSYPTGAETWEVVSSNTNDTSAGSGCRTVAITSLNADYEPQDTVIVSLNGTTPVSLTGTYFRLVSFVGASFGGTDQAGITTGSITLRVASAGATRGLIGAGSTTSFHSHYTVPAGKEALFSQSALFSPKGEDATIITRFKIGAVGPFLIGGSANIYQSPTVYPFLTGLLLPEKSEFLFQSKSTNAGTTITCVAEFEVRDV